MATKILSQDIASLESPLLIADGTVSLPALSFASDTNTGLYSVGSNDVAIATNGVKQLEVSTTAVTTFLPTAIKGTISSDSAAAGNVGEYISAVVTTVTAAPATGTFGDLTSISLTEGDWDVRLQGYWRVGTTVTSLSIGIGTVAGDDQTGLVIGSNFARDDQTYIAGGVKSQVVVPYRISTGTTITIYYKYSATFSVAPDLRGIISARRVR